MAVRGIVVVLAIGFVPAIAFAWFYGLAASRRKYQTRCGPGGPITKSIWPEPAFHKRSTCELPG
ncbi:MAG: hypothetical protein ABW186_10365 [Rhodanobacteraceae bacterium]